jgi:hypothetical protein
VIAALVVVTAADLTTRSAVVAAGADTLDTLRVTSQPTDRGAAEIVVEAERYTDVGNVARARSSAVFGLPTR